MSGSLARLPFTVMVSLPAIANLTSPVAKIWARPLMKMDGAMKGAFMI